MPSHSFAPTASPIFRPGSIQQNYRIKITRLAPEIIVNLRKDRDAGKDPHARDLLRPDELRYFQQNGKNVVIFIHGFNVEYGHYGQQLELSDWGYDILRNQARSARLIRTQGLATTFRDSQAIKHQYANWHAKHPDLFRDVDLDNLNGSGAHAWYLAMEDNLNRATGQFDRTDYSRYTRIINLAWSGDVFEADYMAAETNANQAGFGLAGLIEQLVAEGIAVNVIAHSLGNRVLLVAMNVLGQTNSRKEWIQNAFIWQPAVPDTALSNNPEKDTSVLRNWNFIHAHRAARKIMVLHSNRDNVLGKHADAASFAQDRADRDAGSEAWSGMAGGVYRLATVAGIPSAKMVYAPWHSPALYARNLITDNLPKVETALQQEMAKDANGLFTDHLAPQWPETMLSTLGVWLYARRISREMADDALKTLRALVKADYEVKMPRPAMGYDGPMLEGDVFLRDMRDRGKLSIVNQSLWLSSHSGMKTPEKVLFNEVYQARVMAEIRQSTGFGRY